MCFFSQQTKSAQELKYRFNANFEDEYKYIPSVYNAFEHPIMAAIANNKPGEIKLFQWGLIPSWANDRDIQKYTLNAKIETIHEKPSFRNAIQQRCLIPADGFFEWQWLDAKGKQKQKYAITVEDSDIFAFAGLWNTWTDKQSGEIVDTFTILTTEANELMSRIHNSKQRMPIILTQETEIPWLSNGIVPDLKNIALKAEVCNY